MSSLAAPQPVTQDDRRSGFVALLVASDGVFLGQVTVLSPDKAATTASVFESAQEKVDALGNARLPTGPLMLAFPQFPGPPPIYPIPVTLQAVDAQRGFGVLSLRVSDMRSGPVETPSISLPFPAPAGLLGNGDVPEKGSECEVFYCEERLPRAFYLFRLSGRVGDSLSGMRFRLRLGSNPLSSIAGAPVFRGGVIVGIVSSTSPGGIAFDGGGSDRPSFDAPLYIDVLTVAAMAQSRVTPAIRGLLPWISGDARSPLPTAVGIQQTQTPVRAVADSDLSARPPADEAVGAPDDGGGAASLHLEDSQLLYLLSPSSRSTLERAEGMRRALGQKTVHMRHLVAGLFGEPGGPARQLLLRAGVDEAALMELIRSTTGLLMPTAYEAVHLTELPIMSDSVQEALKHALIRARDAGSSSIQDRHLLYGALSVEHNLTIDALRRRGVRKEDLEQIVGDGPDKTESKISQAAATPQTILTALGANPTPKVASDLWCREDRLGYEAYARTIAELITHEETVAPLTIGIKAPWGAGKTSLMKRVQELLDGYASLSEDSRTGILQDMQPQLTLKEMLAQLKDAAKPMGLELRPGKAYKFPPRITVWFNAWKYQTSEQVWAGMAHCIISQVTARMKVRDRELFWLRLHARRVNVEEVRRKVHESIVRQLIPMAAGMLLVCLAAIWIALAIPILPLRYVVQGVSALAWFFWVRREWFSKLGETAAGTVRNLIHEPDYEGKMGYLHLVESDMREVLDLVTAAQVAPEGLTSGAKAPAQKSGLIAALKALRHPKSGLPARFEGIATSVPVEAVSQPPTDAALKRRSSTKAPLIVFVDDLDRCSPNKVADVVEAINLFLCGDYPNCIFVLGMEPGMVAAALEVANKDVIQKAEEMGLTDQSVPVGWRFMEKIIQLPIMIPPPTKGGRDSYVESLTGMHEFNAHMAEMADSVRQTKVYGPSGMLMSSAILPNAFIDSVRAGATEREPLNEEDVAKYMGELQGRSLSEVEEKSNKVLAEAPQEKRRAAAEASKRAYAQAFVERDPLMAKFVKDVAQLVDGNPRQIKRYVNVFRFYSTLRHSLQVDGVASQAELPSDEMMAKFVALSVHWPHAMDCLRKKDAKASEVNGRKVTLLESLESESRKTPTEVATVDAAWEKFVGKEGLGLGAWAMRPAFREFLSRGESLFQNEGHGLW